MPGLHDVTHCGPQPLRDHEDDISTVGWLFSTPAEREHGDNLQWWSCPHCGRVFSVATLREYFRALLPATREEGGQE